MGPLLLVSLSLLAWAEEEETLPSQPSGLPEGVLLRMRPPWPAGLARLSPPAAKAVRESPDNAFVEFASTREGWRALVAGGAFVQLVSFNLTQFYAGRAEEEARSGGRRLGEGQGMEVEVELKGSMGGYFTNAEVVAELERLTSLYPSWVSRGMEIGKTRRKVPILLYCVTQGDAQGRSHLSPDLIPIVQARSCSGGCHRFTPGPLLHRPPSVHHQV